MVSKASDDLPDPETPVTTVSWLCGISQSTFFRLWTRAPRTVMLSFDMARTLRLRDRALQMGSERSAETYDYSRLAGRSPRGWGGAGVGKHALQAIILPAPQWLLRQALPVL